jgi:hypothetical protein
MKIIVTKEDIENGERRSAQSCPISLAMKRTFQESGRIVNSIWTKYGHSEIYLQEETDLIRIECMLPNEASEFIRNFDYKGEVKPFSFEVEESKGVRYPLV